jgi:Leucine carboxyl methyltransferase
MFFFTIHLLKGWLDSKGAAIAVQAAGGKMTEWSVVIRTYIIDRFIRQLLGKGVDPVVNLGAGADTRWDLRSRVLRTQTRDRRNHAPCLPASVWLRPIARQRSLTIRSSSIFLRRIVGSMFMRVNSKCAHQVRPPSAPVHMAPNPSFKAARSLACRR